MAARDLIDDPVFRQRRIVRFWKLVDQSGGPDACWPWRGHRNDNGYGVLGFLGKRTTAHRVAYELYTGEIIPDDLKARHVVCDNPPCCNPRHVAPGTQKQNLAEMRAKGRGGDCRVFGEQHGRCILTDAQVAEIRHRYANEPCTRVQLAEIYGASPTQIGRIVNGESRTVSAGRQSMLVVPHTKKPGRPRKNINPDNRQAELFLK